MVEAIPIREGVIAVANAKVPQATPEGSRNTAVRAEKARSETPQMVRCTYFS
jgi:hypothetical protein